MRTLKKRTQKSTFGIEMYGSMPNLWLLANFRHILRSVIWPLLDWVAVGRVDLLATAAGGNAWRMGKCTCVKDVGGGGGNHIWFLLKQINSKNAFVHYFCCTKRAPVLFPHKCGKMSFRYIFFSFPYITQIVQSWKKNNVCTKIKMFFFLSFLSGGKKKKKKNKSENFVLVQGEKNRASSLLWRGREPVSYREHRGLLALAFCCP